MDISVTDENTPQPLSGAVNRFRFVLYGDEGIGKSTFALRLIEKRGLWVTADSTWTVALTPEFENTVDRIPWSKLSQIPVIAQRLISNTLNYDKLILDPTSTAFGDALVKFVDKKKLGDQRDPDLPSYGHYYLIMKEAQRLALLLREVPCDVIYVCHVEDDKVPLRPNMNPKAAKALYRECNLIGYMFRDSGDKRKIQLESTSRIVAKTQIPGIPEGVYDADDLLRLLKEWKHARFG